MAQARNRTVHPIAFWATMLLAVIVLLVGLVLAGGGAWLLSLGGSWYYLVAGLALVAAGILMLLRRMLAVTVYAVIYVITLVWAFWESGLDGWALVPRLVGPSVVLLLVLATIPVLRRIDPAPPTGRQSGAVAGLGAIAFALILAPDYLGVNGLHVQAQEAGAGAPASEAPLAPVAPDAVSSSVPPPADSPEPAAPDSAASPDAASTGAARDARAMMTTGEDWPAYGGSIHATRYSPLDQITKQNVGRLTRIWDFQTGDLPSEAAEGKYSPENTPLKVGNSLYVCTPMGSVIALEPYTGKEQWRFDPQVPEDAIPYGATCRGVAYYEVPDAAAGDVCATRIIWGTLDARLLAVDAATGMTCEDFGTGGEIDLEEGIGDTVPGWYAVTSAPTIVRGVVVVGAQVTDGNAEDSPSGVVRGYDAVTGELAWAWDMGSPGRQGEPPEGETYTRGTPNMWTTAAGDKTLGYVYLPLGNSAVDYYGSNRSDVENEYATSLVALDVTTGEPVWHFQTVHHDVWDYDLGSQPSLVDFPSAQGGTIPAIVLASKQGDIYVLDRRTGESLFPVDERPVPQGGVEPGYLSPTQPFSAFHTLAFPPLQERDMWGMTPIDQMWCRIQFRQAHYDGIYTPPSTDRHWIQYPGYNGGNDWGSLAVSPAGVIVANYNDMPNFNRLVPREEVDRLGVTPIHIPAPSPDAPEDIAPQVGAPFGIDVNAGWRMDFTGLMCKEPPYGGIRAIDLQTGETLWDRPLGTARANGPFRIPTMLPFDIGTPNNGGPVVTAGGLIFIAAATDNMIRAIDIDTGETLWQDVLPGGGQATPMIFEHRGHQFVVIYPGGHHFMETPISDHVIAYGLPLQ